MRVGLIFPNQFLYKNYYAGIKRQLKTAAFGVDPGDEFQYAPTGSGAASQSGRCCS